MFVDRATNRRLTQNEVAPMAPRPADDASLEPLVAPRGASLYKCPACPPTRAAAARLGPALSRATPGGPPPPTVAPILGTTVGGALQNAWMPTPPTDAPTLDTTVGGAGAGLGACKHRGLLLPLPLTLL